MPLLKDFNLSSGFKKILSNAGYLFSEKVFNMALSLIVGIYVARYLGPEDYGLWQYAQSFVGLFIAVSGLGTTNVVIRDLVNQPKEEEGKILGTTYLLMLVSGIFLTIVSISIGFWLNNDTVTRWLIIIVSVELVLQSFTVFDYWFQSKVLSKYSVIARTSAKIIVSSLKILFILLSLSVLFFALTVIITGVVNAIIWKYYFSKQGKSIADWRFNSDYAKALLKDTWPLILSGLSVAIYFKIDQVMLKNMIDSFTVGNYAVAARISSLWYFIPVTIAFSVFPSIIISKKENEEKYYRRLQHLYDFMVVLSVAIALPMTFFSDEVIFFLFGEEFSMAGGVLALHIWSGIFIFLGVIRQKWIVTENLQIYRMYFSFLGAVFNIALNLWLIPLLGIMGAAWSSLISYALSGWLLAIIFKKTRIAFRMQTIAILNTLLVYPSIKSMNEIIKEALK